MLLSSGGQSLTSLQPAVLGPNPPGTFGITVGWSCLLSTGMTDLCLLPVDTQLSLGMAGVKGGARINISFTGISLPDRPDPPGSQVLPLHPEGPAGGAAHPARAGPGAWLRLLRAERQLRLHPDPATGLLGAWPCPGKGWGSLGKPPQLHTAPGQGACGVRAVHSLLHPQSLHAPCRRRWPRSSSGRAATRQPWAQERSGSRGLCVTRTPGRVEVAWSPGCVWDTAEGSVFPAWMP